MENKIVNLFDPEEGNHLNFIVFLCLFACFSLVSGCGNSTVEPSKGLSFELPPGWEIFDDVVLEEGRRSISMLTDAGTLVSLETKNCGPAGLPATVNNCLKRYISASLPTKDDRDAARIDLGDVKRIGIDGVFAEIKVSGYDSYIIEVYEVPAAEGGVFIISNSPETKVRLISDGLDYFISNIKM